MSQPQFAPIHVHTPTFTPGGGGREGGRGEGGGEEREGYLKRLTLGSAFSSRRRQRNHSGVSKMVGRWRKGWWWLSSEAVGYKHTSATQERVSVNADVAALTEHRSALKRADKGDTHACGLSGQTEGWTQQGRKNWPKKTQTLPAPYAWYLEGRWEKSHWLALSWSPDNTNKNISEKSSVHADLIKQRWEFPFWSAMAVSSFLLICSPFAIQWLRVKRSFQVTNFSIPLAITDVAC